MQNLNIAVVNNTHQIQAYQSLRSESAAEKIISWTTPVIRDIIVLTVNSVKLLNNVVDRTGQAMETIGDLHRAAKVDSTHLYGGNPIVKWECRHNKEKCGMSYTSIDDVLSECSLGTWGPNGNGWLYWCPNCHTALTPIGAAQKNKEVLDDFFGKVKI